MTKSTAIDSTCITNSLKGARYLLADKGHDANSLRKLLRKSAIVPVIPSRSNRRRSIHYDERRYKNRRLVENAFCRVATRYNKLARNFLSAVALAILIAFWI